MAAPVTEVPAEIAGRGDIVDRQTTSWDLRSVDGPVYRMHIRGGVETQYAGAGYPSVEVHTRHPLLARFDEPSRSLYVSGWPPEPADIAELVEHTIRGISHGWRGTGDFERDPGGARLVLEAGHGLLLIAPASVCKAVASVLAEADVETSILGGAPARPGHCVAVLGRSFVIARGFSFERR